MRQVILALVFTFMMATVGYAQEPQNPPVPARDQQLTEVEQLKIQIANLQIELKNEQSNSAKWIQSYGQCQVSLLSNNQPIVNMLRSLEADIEKNHVGFDFDIKTGEFRVLKPTPPVEKK